MLEKLNPKDVRALKLGVAGIVVIIVFLFISDIKGRWTYAKASYDAMNNKLAELDTIEYDRRQIRQA